MDHEALLKAIAEKMGEDTETVEKWMNKLLHDITLSLDDQGSYTLEGLGTFRLEGDALYFEPEEKLALEVNYKYAGMKPIQITPGAAGTDTGTGEEETEEGDEDLDPFRELQRPVASESDQDSSEWEESETDASSPDASESGEQGKHPGLEYSPEDGEQTDGRSGRLDDEYMDSEQVQNLIEQLGSQASEEPEEEGSGIPDDPDAPVGDVQEDLSAEFDEADEEPEEPVEGKQEEPSAYDTAGFKLDESADEQQSDESPLGGDEPEAEASMESGVEAGRAGGDEPDMESEGPGKEDDNEQVDPFQELDQSSGEPEEEIPDETSGPAESTGEEAAGLEEEEQEIDPGDPDDPFGIRSSLSHEEDDEPDAESIYSDEENFGNTEPATADSEPAGTEGFAGGETEEDEGFESLFEAGDESETDAESQTEAGAQTEAGPEKDIGSEADADAIAGQDAEEPGSGPESGVMQASGTESGEQDEETEAPEELEEQPIDISELEEAGESNTESEIPLSGSPKPEANTGDSQPEGASEYGEQKQRTSSESQKIDVRTSPRSRERGGDKETARATSGPASGKTKDDQTVLSAEPRGASGSGGGGSNGNATSKQTDGEGGKGGTAMLWTLIIVLLLGGSGYAALEYDMVNLAWLGLEEEEIAEDQQLAGDPGAPDPQQEPADPQEEPEEDSEPADPDEPAEPADEPEAEEPVSPEETVENGQYGLTGNVEGAEPAYTLVLYSLTDRQRASSEQQELRELGYRVTLSEATLGDGAVVWRVGVGEFATPDDAVQARSELPERYQDNNFVARVR